MVVVGWIVAVLFFAQGLFLALTPERAVRYTVWKTRLIGARVAEPGRGTIALYRLQGFAMMAMGLFVTYKLVTE